MRDHREATEKRIKLIRLCIAEYEVLRDMSGTYGSKESWQAMIDCRLTELEALEYYLETELKIKAIKGATDALAQLLGEETDSDKLVELHPSVSNAIKERPNAGSG